MIYAYDMSLPIRVFGQHRISSTCNLLSALTELEKLPELKTIIVHIFIFKMLHYCLKASCINCGAIVQACD